MSVLHIVGGGLAGMTVAWEATRPDARGSTPFHEVVLYEATHRLGGKAGSNEAELERPGWSDHGYHLFPLWYRNVIELMGQIGVDYDDVIVEGERFSEAARDPTLMTNQPAPRNRVEKRYRQARPRRVMTPGNDTRFIQSRSRWSIFWVALTAADLVSTDDATLERMSMRQFIDERFPALRPLVLPTYESLLLKALAAETQEMSALAVAKLFRRWSWPSLLTLKDPSWSSLNGSLQQRFIVPFENALVAAGVTAQCDRPLAQVEFDGRVAIRLHFEDGAEDVEAGDRVVLAIPPDVLQRVLADAAPELGIEEPLDRLAGMTAQFAGVDVYFDSPKSTPREHFGFEGDVATTAYNITPVWHPEEFPLPEPATALQLVVPRCDGLDEAALKERVQNELGAVFSFTGATWKVNLNADSRLSLANVGLYEARAKLMAAFENVSISGDFMPSSIGVPSMEGAVGNGRRVAAALRGRDPESVDPDVVVSRTIRTLGRLGRSIAAPANAVWRLAARQRFAAQN